MSGFFGAALKDDCVFDLFFGTDYHAHLGTRRAGMAVYSEETGFDRSIHNIENSPFRTKFERESNQMKGNMGIGCISDYEAQPVLLSSRHGTFAIATVGKINNAEEIVKNAISENAHFFVMRTGEINSTELVAAIINQKENFIEGIRYAQEIIDGSVSIIILTEKGIYAARDKYGRTPVSIGKKRNGMCVSFEDFAYRSLGYQNYHELGPGEIVVFDSENMRTLVAPGDKMKICAFLWVYYGYPSSSYEGLSVEAIRNKCGEFMAKRDDATPDLVAGIPDSGIAYAIGYANQSKVPYGRPFIKYTPTWARSFMPTNNAKRKLIAKMKLIPVGEFIEDKSLLLIDDSIVRGTQLRETTEFLYKCGAREVHVRPACPPLMYTCKYLNFSRSGSEMELITRKVINKLEGDNPDRETLKRYADPDSEQYQKMVQEICNELKFTSLQYNRVDDIVSALGMPRENLCTYCWTGEE